MDTNFYTQMLKEQKKLRSRLARKGERLRKLEEENKAIKLSNLQDGEKYRIEKMRADENLKKYKAQLDENRKICAMYLFWMLISAMSIILNLYFIFK